MGGERGGVSDHVTARKKPAKSGDVSQSAAPKKLVSTPEAGATAMMRDCSITEELVSLKFYIFVYTSCIKWHLNCQNDNLQTIKVMKCLHSHIFVTHENYTITSGSVCD